jgi:hypothetical protein
LKTKTILMILMIAACLGSTLHADNMVFDRGLPTAGVNDPVSADRSNVAWGDYTPYGGQSWAIGDTFNLGLPGSYDITDLRVWIVAEDDQAPSAMWSNLTLYGGGTTDGSIQAISTVNTDGSDPNVEMQKVTYSNGQTYQGSSGAFIDIWQVDFLLNWEVDGSAINTFFVGGTPTALNESLYAPGVSPFLSASNAALSGSPQEGADGLVWEIGGTTPDFFNTNGDGWDKSTDINVQIFATPEPTSVLFLGTVMVFVGSVARRKYQHRRQLGKQ